MLNISMQQMLESGMHFGHQARLWHPKMAPYIYGKRNKIHIVNLETTYSLFDEACQYARYVAQNHGTILYVCTKRQARDLVIAEAQRAGMPYVDQRWLGGTLTNFKTIRATVKRLKQMKETIEKKELKDLTKKETLIFQRELSKLEKNIGGIADMPRLPDAIFVIDIGYHKNTILEAQKCEIPLIGVVDTNHNPESVDFVIPGNDDSTNAIKLYLQGITDAILEGKARIVEEVLAQARGGEDGAEVEVAEVAAKIAERETQAEEETSPESS